MSFKAPTETDLIRQCLDFLKLAGVFAIRVNSGAAIYRDGRAGLGQLVRFNSEPGMSDIIGVLPGGRFCAIEVKRAGARTAPKRKAEQDSFQQRIRDMGGFALTVDSLQNLIDAMREVGVR